MNATNHNDTKQRGLLGLAPLVIGLVIALVLAVLVGNLIHEAFAAVTDAMDQAGAR